MTTSHVTHAALMGTVHRCKEDVVRPSVVPGTSLAHLAHFINKEEMSTQFVDLREGSQNLSLTITTFFIILFFLDNPLRV